MSLRTPSVRGYRHSAARARTGHGRCHPPAFGSAAPTCLYALATVIVRILRAFLGAGIAKLRADLTEHTRELAPARHERNARATGFGAIDVQRDASREAANVLLHQGGGGAVVARNRAVIAGVDGSLHGFMGHGRCPRASW